MGDCGYATYRPVLGGSVLLLFANQVMKMIMTLNVQESGLVKYIKRPGAVLEAGCVVARLELDDPSKVHAVCGASSQPLRPPHPSPGLPCAGRRLPRSHLCMLIPAAGVVVQNTRRLCPSLLSFLSAAFHPAQSKTHHLWDPR